MSRTRSKTLRLLVSLAAAVAVAAGAGGAQAAQELAPHSLCGAPLPGKVSCLGVKLEHVNPWAPPPGAFSSAKLAGVHAHIATGPAGGLTPGDLVAAYSLQAASAQPSTQTIAIVDSFGDPTIESDLATFSQQYGLPACTVASGCLTVVNQNGQTSNLPPLPDVSDDWTGETALDVETAHGICPNCKLLLVQADDDSTYNLDTAENTAATWPGVSVVSDSWGGPEYGDDPAFRHPGVVITVATGDNGFQNWDARANGPEYPSTSPFVVAVGGTRLNLAPNGSWAGETVWNNDASCNPTTQLRVGCYGGTGGGCSNVFQAPSWQQSDPGWNALGCGTFRAAADVAADADPQSGIDIYDSSLPQNNCHNGNCWQTVGGTSLAAPLIGAMFALAGGANGIAYPAQTLYANELAAPGTLHDVVSGGSGACDGANPCNSAYTGSDCGGATRCNAAAGYDGPTGVGTPNGIGAFLPAGGEVSQVPSGGSGTPAPAHGAPTPRIASSTGLRAGVAATFDGSGSTAQNATISTYQWTFGDGASAGGAVVSHTYSAAATYYVTLTVTDSSGSSAATGEWLTVSPAAGASVASASAPHLDAAGAPSVKLVHGRITVLTGKALVCPSTFSGCTASMTLRARVGRRLVVVGQANVASPGGQSAQVAVTLNTAGRSALIHAGRLRASGPVVLGGDGSTRATTQLALTLRLSRRS